MVELCLSYSRVVDELLTSREELWSSYVWVIIVELWTSYCRVMFRLWSSCGRVVRSYWRVMFGL